MIKRLAIATLLVVLLVPVGCYWSWPWWSTGLLRAVVAGHGLELAAATISRPGLGSLTVEDLDVRYAGPNVQARVQAPLLTLRYQPARLLRGNIDSLVAPRLAIAIQPASTASADQKPSHAALAALLPEQLLAQSPIAVLQIDNLSVESSLLPDYPIVNGALRMNRDELAATLASPGPAALELKLALNRHNTVNARLQLDQELAIQLTGAVTVSDDQRYFGGQINAALGVIRELLRSSAVLPPDAALSGQLQADWQLPLPATVSYAALQELRVAGQLTASGTAKLEGILDAGQFSLASAFDLGTGHSLMELSQFGLSGALPAPEALIAVNPAFAGKPLAAKLELDPGTRIRFGHALNTLDVDNLHGRLALDHLAGLQSTVVVTGAALTAGDTLRGTATFSASAQLARVATPDYSAEQLQLTANGALSAGSGQVTFNALGPVNVQAINSNINKYLLPNINVTCDSFSGVTINQQGASFAKAGCSVNGQTITGPLLSVTFPRATVELQDAGMSFSDDPRPAANLRITVPDIAISERTLQLHPFNVKANLALSANRLKGTFTGADAHQLLSAKGDIEHDLTSGAGQLVASMVSAGISKKTAYLPRLIKNLAIPIDMTNGQFHVAGGGSWDAAQTEFAAQVLLSNIDGFYNRNLFRGLNGTLRLHSTAGGTTVAAERIHLTEANVGLLIKNIRFGLSSGNTAIVATGFRAELLGGEVSQKEILYDWTRAENRFVINLHDIQLAEVLKLESGITGTGTLGGQLPIALTQSGISIEHGGISAKAPGGVLKYNAGKPLTGAAANAGLKLTLDALKNFHYNVLTARLDYAQSGDLDLKVRLEGRNPDLKVRRPFLFNLNISENIPALLKSLQLTQEISDDLDRRIKAFY